MLVGEEAERVVREPPPSGRRPGLKYLRHEFHGFGRTGGQAGFALLWVILAVLRRFER